MTQQSLQKTLHRLSFNRRERLAIFRQLPSEEQGGILFQLSRQLRTDLLGNLMDAELIQILEHLDPDEATDIVQLLPLPRQKMVVAKFSAELKNSVEILSQFDPETAAGLMNLDYIQVDSNDSIESVARQFYVHEKRTGRLPAIMVMARGKLLGYLPGHRLGTARRNEKAKVNVRKIPVLKQNVSHDEVVRFFRSHPHNKVAVMGSKGNIVGIIYSDDVLKILQDKTAHSLYHFAGVHQEESVRDSALLKVRSRYKWLIINLGTGFLAAFTVSLFEDTISRFVLLAAYMPIVAGMGGNAATQTLAVLVRGITLKQIELKTAWKTVVNELKASFVNGFINGLLVAGVVIAVNRDYKMAMVLAFAMLVNLLVAGFFGTIVPLIMERLGKDPAASATIFITTATDVLGFLAFLGMAALIL